MSRRDAVFQGGQQCLEACEEAVEEIGGGRGRPVKHDRFLLAFEAPCTSRILEQPGFVRLLHADRRAGTELDPEFPRELIARWSAGIELRRNLLADHAELFAGSECRGAVQGLAVEPRQVLIAVGEAAAPEAQCRDFRCNAAVAEHLDPNPEIAAGQRANTASRILDQRREQPVAIALALPRSEARMGRQLRWPGFPCGLWFLQRRRAPNVVAKSMRAPD